MIGNYISVQNFRFWVSFLEEWAIFDLFVTHWPLGCPKKDQNVWFNKWMPQSSSSCKFMCVCTFFASSYHFIPNGKFWPPPPPPPPPCDPLLTPGASKMTFAWEIALGIKQLWKIILSSIKNRWKTSLSKLSKRFWF